MVVHQTIHLPDGQNFAVTPVFAGFFFKSLELSTHSSVFPIGWTIVLHTEDDCALDGDGDGGAGAEAEGHEDDGTESMTQKFGRGEGREDGREAHVHRFTTPTLQNDNLFISSISIPSSVDFRPSPTRQIAMMLWVTLYWYFHQPEPPNILHTEASKATPESGKPRGEWRINIKREGIFGGRNLIPKLERMGLISTLDSAVGTAVEDSSEGWSHMFVSRKMFWQIPGRLFLFTLQHNLKGPPHSHPGSPTSSRPGSPALNESAGRPQHSPSPIAAADVPGAPPPLVLTSLPSFPIGPYYSSSNLPTYYPPPPAQFTMTDGLRHPIRPKPPRMGEVFYTRFVPSVGQYLSFRVASLSPKPVPYLGPVIQRPPPGPLADLTTLSDTSLLQMWLAKPRVSAFWGGYTPDFLTNALNSRHSFPAVGMWDGVPFGYLEIYWVKEDALGRHAAGEIDDWDRGFHVFVGEDWARGRVASWLTSVVHWTLCADYRTMTICVEPRVDNKRKVTEFPKILLTHANRFHRFIQHLQAANFSKEKEIAFPHKQAWFGRLRRDVWEGPAL